MRGVALAADRDAARALGLRRHRRRRLLRGAHAARPAPRDGDARGIRRRRARRRSRRRAADERVLRAVLAEALDRGLLDAATLDASVRRVLRLKFALGIFERPYADLDAIELDRPDERALAREVAERSIVLLANDGVLPLAAGAARVAVIGPNADDPMALFGNYSFQNHVAAHFPDVPHARAATAARGAARAPRRRARRPSRRAAGSSRRRATSRTIAPASRLPPSSRAVRASRSSSSATRPATSAPARWGRAATPIRWRCRACRASWWRPCSTTGVPTVIVLVNGRALRSLPHRRPRSRDRRGLVPRTGRRRRDRRRARRRGESERQDLADLRARRRRDAAQLRREAALARGAAAAGLRGGVPVRARALVHALRVHGSLDHARVDRDARHGRDRVHAEKRRRARRRRKWCSSTCATPSPA